MRDAVLIVDDEPFVRLELAEALSEEGFRTYEAANTAEALAILQTAPGTFAAVISDIHMPGTRSGVVLARHVKHVWPEIAVLVISGGRQPLRGELPIGATFLAKPCSRPDLSAAISGMSAG